MTASLQIMMSVLDFMDVITDVNLMVKAGSHVIVIRVLCYKPMATHAKV